MSFVFHLTHVYEQPCGCEEMKDLGTYSDAAKAEAARALAATLPGFRDHPDGFHIQETQLDKAEWTEGFVTVPGVEDGVRLAMSKLAGIHLDRIAASMKESDGRRISRREVGEFATPLDVETMARVLIEIRDAVSVEAAPFQPSTSA